MVKVSVVCDVCRRQAEPPFIAAVVSEPKGGKPVGSVTIRWRRDGQAGPGVHICSLACLASYVDALARRVLFFERAAWPRPSEPPYED